MDCWYFRCSSHIMGFMPPSTYTGWSGPGNWTGITCCCSSYILESFLLAWALPGGVGAGWDCCRLPLALAILLARQWGVFLAGAMIFLLIGFPTFILVSALPNFSFILHCLFARRSKQLRFQSSKRGVYQPQAVTCETALCLQ